MENTNPDPRTALPADAPEDKDSDVQAGKDTEAGAGKGLLSEHKGKLAVGVAATLGMLIYYGWRQRNLPKEDPEAYAQLQRIRDRVKADETDHALKDDEPNPDAAAAGRQDAA